MKSKVISRLLIWLLPALAIMLTAVVGFGMIICIDNIPSFVILALCGLIVSSQILIINSKKKSTGVKISLAVICMVVLVVVGFLALLMPKKIMRSTSSDPVSKFEAGVSKVYDGEPLNGSDAVKIEGLVERDSISVNATGTITEHDHLARTGL